MFILSQKLFDETSNIKIHLYKKGRFNWLRRLLFDNYILNRLCKRYEIDGVLSFQNTISFTSRLPQLVYMHQVIPFQKEKTFSFLRKDEMIYAVYQHLIGSLIRKSVEKADLVVVQAEWLRELVKVRTNSNPDKIIVNRLDCKVNDAADDVNMPIWSNHFFYPAFECIYKNQTVIRQACAILQAQNIDAVVELTIDSEYTESTIIKSCGKLPHNDVMNRFRSSTLIFPSYLETVGLPLVEAMSANALILAADCQYAHETLKNYPNAYFFDPFNPEELAELMKNVIDGKITRVRYDYSPSCESDWSNVIYRFTEVIQCYKNKLNG